MPSLPHIVSGKVRGVKEDYISGATISLTHTNGTLTTTSDSEGYSLNLGNLSSWSVGDSITVTATSGNLTGSTITTVSEGGSQTVNITLTEPDDLSPERQKIKLSDFAGDDINTSNPLPVFLADNYNIDILKNYAPSDEDRSTANEYYGFLDKNGNWYIQQYNYDVGTMRYAKGTDDYGTNWTNRASLNYQRFNEVF